MALSHVVALFASGGVITCVPADWHVQKAPAHTTCFPGSSSSISSSGNYYCHYEDIVGGRATARNRLCHRMEAAAKLRSDFIQVLRSHRIAEVSLTVEIGKPVANPMYQGGAVSSEAMESCPKENAEDFKDRLVEENLYLIKVPLTVEIGKPVVNPMYQGGAVSSEAMESCPKENVEDFKDRLVEENLYLIKVPLTVEIGKPVANPMYQGGAVSTEAMESCPKENVVDFKDRLVEENLYLITEAGEQGRLPVLILSMKQSKQERRPAIVFLHSSYKSKEWLRPLLEAYASRDYIAVAIDSRYHGERASKPTTYRDALISSWRYGNTMPFIYDTVWDLLKLGDYLSQREDIDPAKIGITGESLGGMHAWFAAAADTRYAVVVPILGVQGFRWALDNDQWQARVDSIRPLFEEARSDLGKSAIDKEVVEKVWNRIAPGLASAFDSPYTVPIIVPRPLLIINGAEDPRCPLGGLQTPKSRTIEAYEEANCAKHFKLTAEPGIEHQMTSSMVKEASDWFDRFLK